MRSTREKAPKVPEMSLVLVCSARCSALALVNRCTARPVKPIAFSTSALRALESAIALRWMTALWVDAERRRVISSVAMVSPVSTKAPASVSPPSQGCSM